MEDIVFTMKCAYCETTIRMTKMPEPTDILICKYCCGLFRCSIITTCLEEMDDPMKSKVEAALREMKHEKWVN